jgi:hypothetical protein
MKFLVPNYSCLQNPWLGGYRSQIPILSVLCSQLNLLNPPLPPKKFLGTPLDGGECSASRTKRFIPMARSPVPIRRNLGVPQSRSGNFCAWMDSNPRSSSHSLVVIPSPLPAGRIRSVSCTQLRQWNNNVMSSRGKAGGRRTRCARSFRGTITADGRLVLPRSPVATPIDMFHGEVRAGKKKKTQY